MRWRCAGVWATALVVSIAGLRAAASDPLDVSLAIDRCIDADADAVQRLFLMEFGTSTTDSTVLAKSAAAQVNLTCEGDLVVIQVNDPITGKSLLRRIEPGSRSGRERLLALAVLELLVASWIELEATPEPAVPGVDIVADADVRKSARQVVRRQLPTIDWTTSVALIGGSTWSDSLHGSLGMRLLRDHNRGFGWAVDVTGQAASETVPLGTVNVYALSTAVTLHLQHSWQWLQWRAGAGARIGAAALEGIPENPDRTSGSRLVNVIGGPLVRTGVQASLWGGMTVVGSAEVGSYVLGTQALVDGNAVTGLTGIWLGGHLGLGWTW